MTVDPSTIPENFLEDSHPMGRFNRIVLMIGLAAISLVMLVFSMIASDGVEQLVYGMATAVPATIVIVLLAKGFHRKRK